MKKTRLLMFIVVFLFSAKANGYDNHVAHPQITGRAITNSIIHDYLDSNLKLPSGTDTLINGRTISEWLTMGSTIEDEPQCRASNHFHNPLREWDESGMRDQPWFVNGWCSGGDYPTEDINSAVHWATGYVEPAPGSKEYTGNEWDWDYAREHYFTYLTGQNLSWNTVAETVEEREEYFAISLRALGQVLPYFKTWPSPPT